MVTRDVFSSVDDKFEIKRRRWDGNRLRKCGETVSVDEAARVTRNRRIFLSSTRFLLIVDSFRGKECGSATLSLTENTFRAASKYSVAWSAACKQSPRMIDLTLHARLFLQRFICIVFSWRTCSVRIASLESIIRDSCFTPCQLSCYTSYDAR